MPTEPFVDTTCNSTWATVPLIIILGLITYLSSPGNNNCKCTELGDGGEYEEEDQAKLLELFLDTRQKYVHVVLVGFAKKTGLHFVTTTASCLFLCSITPLSSVLSLWMQEPLVVVSFVCRLSSEVPSQFWHVLRAVLLGTFIQAVRQRNEKIALCLGLTRERTIWVF